jgi:hypothetical protein
MTDTNKTGMRRPKPDQEGVILARMIYEKTLKQASEAKDIFLSEEALKNYQPYLKWCIAHCLELALEDDDLTEEDVAGGFLMELVPERKSRFSKKIS